MRKKNANALQSMDVPLFRRWQALYLSFYSSALYIDVAKRWRGLGLIYLLMMLSITTLPYSLQRILDYSVGIDNDLILVLKELPTLTLNKGIISIREPMPYLIKNKKGEVVAMINTKTSFPEVRKDNPKMVLFIGKNQIYSRDSVARATFIAQHAKTIKPADLEEPYFSHKTFSAQDNGVFSVQDVMSVKSALMIKWILAGALYLSLTSFYFSFYAFLFFSLAFVGQMIGKLFFRVKLSYAASFRLLTVAATPQAVIFFPLLAFDLFPQVIGFAFLVLLLGYYSYALLVLRKANKVLVRT